jgi:phage shock protein A
MTREQAYELIDAERTSQDAVWTNRTQYNRAAPHILLLEEQLKKLRTDWYASKSENFTSRLTKMAAIAVRALEEIDPEA